MTTTFEDEAELRLSAPRVRPFGATFKRERAVRVIAGYLRGDTLAKIGDAEDVDAQRVDQWIRMFRQHGVELPFRGKSRGKRHGAAVQRGIHGRG